MLETITSQQEIISDNPWSLDDAPANYIDAMCRAIVGFKLPIGTVQAQFKLSQNKTEENITGVINGLNDLNTHQASTMVQKMAKHNSR
ncbi:FMN-binding negative transcriptional regulator [Psychrobacter sp. APC 3426]|uniref:FMN-binding negative transcriptional regulator n=1 Tax=Psychrobacter sp. APC 3426 TaxID=3035177 RepID=UPI0033B9E3D9